MSDAYVQVPNDSTGKRIAQQMRTRGGLDVMFQEVSASYPADAVCIAVQVNATSGQVLPANLTRRWLALQNVSDTWMYCRFSAVPVATAGFEEGFALGPYGGSMTFAHCIDQRNLNAVHAGIGGKRLLITEFSG